MSEFNFPEPSDDKIPARWAKNPPWKDDPDLSDLFEVMQPLEREHWSEGGQSHQEREVFLARIEARWRKWRDIAWQRSGRKPERPSLDLSPMLQKILGPPSGAKQSEPAKPPKAPGTKLNLEPLRDEIGRAGKVMEEAAEIIRRKPAPRKSIPPEQRPYPRAKLIGAFVVAFVALVGSVASAFQVAGVLSVALAHSIIVLGWFGFMASLLLIEHLLALHPRRKVVVTSVAGVIAAFFLFGMDRWMVSLKAQQQLQDGKIVNKVEPATSPAVDAISPRPTVKEQADRNEERVAVDIAPEKLLEFFEKYNEAQAEGLTQPYLGKWVEMTGKVTEVSRELAPLRDDTRGIKYAINVVVRTRRQDKPKSHIVTHAVFEDQRWMDRAVVLKRNEDIKVRGKIRSVYAHGFHLEHCEIIE